MKTIDQIQLFYVRSAQSFLATTKAVIMNVKKIFWRFYFGNTSWSRYKAFGVEYVPDQLGGVNYAAIIAFRYALIYSDNW